MFEQLKQSRVSSSLMVVLGVLGALMFMGHSPLYSWSAKPPVKSVKSSKVATRQARLWSVDIHADWCPACQHIEPAYQQVKSTYQDRIYFVRFDVTGRKSTEMAVKQAESLGLTPWFNEYQSQTSTVALMDGKTHQVVALFQNEGDFKAYQQAYDQALKPAKK